MSKRDFGKLDHLLCEKQNPSTLSLEAIVLFSSNKTMKWLNSAVVVQHLLQIARKKAPDFKLFKQQRKQDILARHIKALHEKQCDWMLHIKGFGSEGKLTQDIIHCSLWQTREEITTGLAKQKSKTGKLKVLKIQLRKPENYHDKELFLFSKSGQQYPVDKPVKNLCKLICNEGLVHEQANNTRESLESSTSGEMKMELNNGILVKS